MGGGGGRRRSNRGEDLRVRIALTLEEIATGATKKIKVNNLIACEACDGSGVAAGSSRKTCPQCRGAGRVRTVSQTFLGTIQQVTTCSACRGSGEIIADPCSTCRGEGRVRGSSTVSIDIPPGVSSGNYMTVEGKGNFPGRSGQPGDLIAVFEEKSHELFERHGDHIVLDYPIPFTTAALGGDITVPTLDGDESLKVPPGTQSGKILKMRGKGIPRLHHGGRGDQLVRVTVWVPTKLNPDDKKKLRELDRSGTFEPPKGNKTFFDKLRETLGV
jgi:molecular chaperone DnaJ